MSALAQHDPPHRLAPSTPVINSTRAVVRRRGSRDRATDPQAALAQLGDDPLPGLEALDAMCAS